MQKGSNHKFSPDSVVLNTTESFFRAYQADSIALFAIEMVFDIMCGAYKGNRDRESQ
ncbi:hypothetical protein D3C73_1575660 [compost metagenome]